MSNVTKKAVLSAKDSVNGAISKLTKLATDMDIDNNENVPSPEQVKEVIESIADVATEIVQQADQVAEGLEKVTGDGPEPPIDDEPPVENEEMKAMQAKIAAQEDEIKILKEKDEKSEKEKMASEFANLFPTKIRAAKYKEFMAMDKPIAELKTVLSASENVISTVQKSASMGVTGETIIFKESKQKNASMGLEGMNFASSLSEI